MKRFLFAFASLLLVSSLVFADQPPVAVSNTASGGRELSVTGEAWGNLAPDTARITISIEETAPSAKEAEEAVNKKQETLKKALEAIGNISLQVQDERFTGAAPGSAVSKSAVVRYKRSLVASPKELTMVASIIDAAMNAGVGAVPQVEYLVRQSGPKVQEVLSQATQDAFAKAQAIAKTANATLGAMSYITVTEEPDAQVLREEHQVGSNLTPSSGQEVHALVTVGVELK